MSDLATRSKKATRARWLEAALDLLDRRGDASLTIDRLCTEMGKTKGGFYHHFGDAKGLREAILDHWEARNTGDIIDAAERVPASERAATLDQLAGAANWAHERALRRWAWNDEAVRARVATVDARRITYLAALYPSASPARSIELATLEYAAFIGAQHMFGVTDGDALAALLRRALLGAQRESP